MRKTFPEKHKQLWLWLSENPKCTKLDSTIWEEMRQTDIPTQHCFACEEAVIRREEDGKDWDTCRCYYCPICKLIPGESIACIGGLYTDYVHEINLARRRYLALKIANLPWR